VYGGTAGDRDSWQYHGRTEELLERGRWQQQERVMGPVWTGTFGSIMSVQRSYWSEAVGNNKNV